MKETINPWKFNEIKDYDVDQFGIENIDNILKKLPKEHRYFTRRVIFGHKDLQVILKAKKDKMPFAMLTGLMPSGKFHFGHKIVVDEMVYFQEIGAECYVVVADIESYLTRDIPIEKAREIAINEYIANYLALGLDPKKTKFFFQSDGSKEYVNLSKYVSKRTTLNELKSIYGELTPGKIISIFNQVSDILFPQLKENKGPKPTIVPVGLDQLPHINLTRDIANRMKSEYDFILPSAIFHKLISGLKGGKMSSSEPENAIFLSDSDLEVKKKINNALTGGRETVEEQRKKGGIPDSCKIHEFLAFYHPDDKLVKELFDRCKSGDILCGECKQLCLDFLLDFLKEHREKLEKTRKIAEKIVNNR